MRINLALNLDRRDPISSNVDCPVSIGFRNQCVRPRFEPQTVHEDHIRFGRRVVAADWSSESATWAVKTESADGAETEVFTCNFLSMCAGYYSYREGYTPDFPGAESFRGPGLEFR